MKVGGPIRVLVVEDSLTIRKRLVEVLAACPGIVVVGEAEDGERAVDLCRSLRPDVITLDIVMPKMSGLAVTEYVMAHFPTPILIVSASLNRGELMQTYDALEAGAVDVLDKPTGGEPNDEWELRFVASVRLVARISVITHLRGRRTTMPEVASTQGLSSLPSRQVVAIGASTGGPAALVTLLRALPAPFPMPILLVLHLGEPFGSALAEWLDTQSAHRVRSAVDGLSLRASVGHVIMAPPGRHLELRDGALRLSQQPERHSCRPSIDVLFESVAKEIGAHATGVVLTGMGRDGAAGLLRIRQRGGRTIAQDEASSVVYGMPREAARLGAAARILPLTAIAPALTALVTATGSSA